MKTEDFSYALPPDRIAQYPAEQRDDSRLLVFAGSEITDTVFAALAAHLPPASVLVLNDVKVRQARLRLPVSMGKGEILFLRPVAAGQWLVMGRPGRKLRPGRTVTWPHGLTGTVEAVLADGLRRMRFTGNVETYLAEHGELPLPPYIDRAPTEADRERYQTVYAGPLGAVAAPTAGLHFTRSQLDQLAAGGVDVLTVTLQVGAGTFRPIRTATVLEHEMEAEFFEVPEATAAAVNAARAAGRPVIAVGTTVVRTLESAAGDDGLRAGSGWTRLFITPGYRFRIIDGLLTNFHLPRTSLLVLVAALLGRERLLGLYRHAVDRGYRFYSYGDAMLVLPEAINAV